jgi:hypothetical protein
VLQFLLSPLLLWQTFLSTSLSTALYAVSLSYYHYMNFLGYSALPFLERTEVRSWGARLCGAAVHHACCTAGYIHCILVGWGEGISACCCMQGGRWASTMVSTAVPLTRQAVARYQASHIGAPMVVLYGFIAACFTCHP